MIKGINKQIIEIKCTNNEYFDKILLFVNSEKYNISGEILKDQALKYSENIVRSYSERECKKSIRFQIIALAICFAVFVAAVIALCM